MDLSSQIEHAVDILRYAEAILIAAGAGMSVDSGIPAFRLNPEGVLPEDPVAASKQRLPVGPIHFRVTPRKAWATTGARLKDFREAIPHEGYQYLLHWMIQMPAGGFVLTSNVDGQFAKAGFPDQQIFEGHGSLQYLQCCQPCQQNIWGAQKVQLIIDEEEGVVRGPLPTCPSCGDVARPNVFFFGDPDFVKRRAEAQNETYKRWLASIEGRPLAIVECGAGTAVPTIRKKCEALAANENANLIRINPMEPQGPEGTLSIPLGALDALRRIEHAWRKRL